MTDTDPSDVQLVSRMANGDGGALSLLYERHSPRLLGLAITVLGDRAEAEDLLHDVFLEAWRRSADYDPERGSVRAWLTVRTRSRSLDRVKSRGRRRDVPTEKEQPETSFSPNLEDQHRLGQVLRQLPEPQRNVIVLAYFEDLTSSEIGVRLGIPTGTVKSRMRSALAALRDVLSEPNDAQ